MIDGEVVTAIRTLAERGVGKKAIARELYETGAGNAVVVQRLLAARDVTVSVRTVERQVVHPSPARRLRS